MSFIPTNAVSALQVARAESKAKAIITEGYTFEAQEGTSLIAVCKPGKLAAAYWIETASDGFWQGCSCPSFQKSGAGYCKHTLALKRIQEEEANQLAGEPTEEEEFGQAWYSERAALKV